jgi:hypothetical protein
MIKIIVEGIQAGFIMKISGHLLAFSFVLFFISCNKQGTDGVATTTFSMYRNHGLDVDWDHSGTNRIAYSMKGDDGYYDIHTAGPDGSNDSCLTCLLVPLTDKHIAVPSWHPSGNWLLMTVEKPVHAGSSFDALPGLGSYTDIWIMDPDGLPRIQFFPLYCLISFKVCISAFLLFQSR